MLPLFKVGLGGRFGDGKQWMSWIALDDHVGAVVHLLTSELAGPVDLTAPNPVRNAELADTIGTVLRRPTIVPVPSFGPRLVLGGERADALLFEGQRVLPRRLLADGYEFAHPTLDGALRAVLGRDSTGGPGPIGPDPPDRWRHPLATPDQRATSAGRSRTSRPEWPSAPPNGRRAGAT